MFENSYVLMSCRKKYGARKIQLFFENLVEDIYTFSLIKILQNLHKHN